jgi:hypothetical protein
MVNNPGATAARMQTGYLENSTGAAGDGSLLREPEREQERGYEARRVLALVRSRYADALSLLEIIDCL